MAVLNPTELPYVCPTHKKPLHEHRTYRGAWVHSDCIDIFTPVDGHLCRLIGGQWHDCETGEVVVAKLSLS